MKGIQLRLQLRSAKYVFEHFFFDFKEIVLLTYFSDFSLNLEAEFSILVTDVLHQSDISFFLRFSLLRPLHDKVVERLFRIGQTNQTNLDLGNEILVIIAVMYLETILHS